MKHLLLSFVLLAAHAAAAGTMTATMTPGSTALQGCMTSQGASDGMYTAPQSTCACWFGTAPGAEWEGPNPGVISSCIGCAFDVDKYLYIPAGTVLSDVRVNIIYTADDHIQVYANGGMVSSCFNPGGYSPCAVNNPFLVPTANLQIGWNTFRFHVMDEWQGWHGLSYSICWDLTGLATPTPIPTDTPIPSSTPTASPTATLTATAAPTALGGTPVGTPSSNPPQGCMTSQGANDGMYTAPLSTCACWNDTAPGAQWEGPLPGAVSTCWGCTFDLDKYLYIPAGTVLANVRVSIIYTADDHIQVYSNGTQVASCINPGGYSPCTAQNPFVVPTASLQIGWNTFRFHVTDAWQGWHALSYSICWDLTGLATPTPNATSTPVPASTPTFTASLTLAATSPPTIQASPTQGSHGHKNLHCHGNFQRGPHARQKFTLWSPVSGSCRLRIMRGNGRLLRALWAGHLEADEEKQVDWGFEDEHNGACESGVYFAVFEDASGKVHKEKVLLVR